MIDVEVHGVDDYRNRLKSVYATKSEALDRIEPLFSSAQDAIIIYAQTHSIRPTKTGDVVWCTFQGSSHSYKVNLVRGGRIDIQIVDADGKPVQTVSLDHAAGDEIQRRYAMGLAGSENAGVAIKTISHLSMITYQDESIYDEKPGMDQEKAELQVKERFRGIPVAEEIMKAEIQRFVSATRVPQADTQQAIAGANTFISQFIADIKPPPLVTS